MLPQFGICISVDETNQNQVRSARFDVLGDEPLRYLVGIALPVPRGMTPTSAPFGMCSFPLAICSSMLDLEAANRSRVKDGRTIGFSDDTAG